MKLSRTLSVLLILVFSIGISTVSVRAQPTATIYPSEGTVDTNIFLKVRGFGIGEEWDVHYKLYLFWDSKPIMTGVDDGGSHFYDIYFNPPNEHPYSDLRNHTVYVELWRSHYGWTFIANFTLVFRILEWAPCPEYLALNATYYALLSDYNDLLDDYNSLLVDFAALQANYSTLQNNYNSLSTDYEDLLARYISLATDFGSLSWSYRDLESSYESLDSTYFDLFDTFGELQSDYSDLQNSYSTLSADYSSLESSLNTLTNDLGTTRIVSYIFILTTIAFVAATVYLVARKPKSSILSGAHSCIQ